MFRKLRPCNKNVSKLPPSPTFGPSSFLFPPVVFVEGLPASPEVGAPVSKPSVVDVGGGNQGPRGRPGGGAAAGERGVV